MLDTSERYDGIPAPAPFPASAVIEDLGDGLVLRRASAADATSLAALSRIAHADPPDFNPDEHVGPWTHELMECHPTMRAQDFLVVEDTLRKRIASTLCLVGHHFSYAGVDFDAGQVELVATHPDYRRRGLVSRQFETVHAWSQERGHRMQVIEGIPWYYRQFGYEMALELNDGRVALRSELSAAQASPLRCRPATPDDAPLLARAHEAIAGRSLLACHHDVEYCGFEIDRPHPIGLRRREFKVVEDSAGNSIAIFAHYPILLSGSLFVPIAECLGDSSWREVVPALLAELRRCGDAMAEADGGAFENTFFRLSSEHPLYEATAKHPPKHRAYAMYIRVEDPAEFLRLVAPALEERLAGSELAGFEGELALDFYRRGVRLHFRGGRLREVEEWQPSTAQVGDIRFPDSTFLQLLLGYRTVSDLEFAFADCLVAEADHRRLANALFPRGPSQLILCD